VRRVNTAASANSIIEVSTMAAGADFDTTLHQIAQAILTVLAVINPVVCGSIFLTLIRDRSGGQPSTQR
jgi:hypothetical protein